MPVDIFLPCASPDVWLRELKQYLVDPGAAIPVLAAGVPSSAAELYVDHPSRAIPTDGEKRYVAFSRSSAIAPYASTIAKALGAKELSTNGWSELMPRLVRESSAPGPTFLAVLGLSNDIVEEEIALLEFEAHKAHEVSCTEVHLGFVLGTDVAQLSWTVAKSLAYPRRRTPETAITPLYPAVNENRFSQRERASRQDADFGSVSQLFSEPIGLLSVMSHGREDVLHLPDSVLCAYRPELLRTTVESNLPTCAFTGQCCRGDVSVDHIISVDSLHVELVFANSCMGFRTSAGTFPDRYLLPHGFARGHTVGYIGSRTLASGREKLNRVVEAAFEVGIPLGAIASLVNDHLRLEGSGEPSFSLSGFPWLRFRSAHASLEDSRIRSVLIADHDSSLQSTARTIAASGEFEDELILLVSPRTQRVSRLLGTALEPGAAARVPIEKRLRQIGRMAENIADLPFVGLRTSKAGNFVNTIRDQSSTLASQYNQLFDTDRPSKIVSKVARLEEVIARAEKDIADSLFERGKTSSFEFEDLWADILVQSDLGDTADQCGRCGRTLRAYRSEHPILPRIARTSRRCPRCMLVEDLDARSNLMRLELTSEAFWPRSSIQTVRLRLATSSELSHGTRVLLGTVAKNAHKYGVTSPDLISLVMGPDEDVERSIDVRVEPREGLYHQDLFKAFAVCEGTVNFACTCIWYRPDTWRPYTP